MEKNGIFEKNLIALSGSNPALCARLAKTQTAGNHYNFITARTGELIPARIDEAGTARPLHSTIDPRKEARRLIEAEEGESFFIFLGLGAGFYAEAALEHDNTSMALVIEYDIKNLAELLSRLDYTRLFSDPRFTLTADLSDSELEAEILKLYRPVLCGGIRVIPLRSRTIFDTEAFTNAAKIISSAIEKVSADYSVQAHFGRRWFSNIIRNLLDMGDNPLPQPAVKKAAVTAAGPSLTLQLRRILEKRKEVFLIATDTSLPCLLDAEIIPDAVISIDCQHISYYHFMDGLPEGVPLFLDLASPPLLASLSKDHHFLSCGHPLTSYISRSWKSLPELDSSGGNVTYAAVSLAEQLGAMEIELYGADYSYPAGVTYAKGTYIYSFFAKRQNRLSPPEAQASAFLYRTPVEKKFKGNSFYYETNTLRFYREKLEKKAETMEADLIPVEGRGAPIIIRKAKNSFIEKAGKVSLEALNKTHHTNKKPLNPADFLLGYRNNVYRLPVPGKNAVEYLSLLKEEELALFTSLLPLAAALKHRYKASGGTGSREAAFGELMEITKDHCIKEIDRILTQ